MSDNQIIRAASQADDLLKNAFFQKDIWECYKTILDNRMLSCDTAKNPEIALDIIRYRQILNEIETIIKQAVKQGEAIKAKQLKELQKPTVIERVFER